MYGTKNPVKKLANALSRPLNEFFVNIKDIYAHKDIIVRVRKIREALIFLKTNHRAISSISIIERNLSNIVEELRHISLKRDLTEDTNNEFLKFPSTAEIVHDAGQNEIVEESIA